MPFWEKYSAERSRKAEMVAEKNEREARVIDRQINPNRDQFDAYLELPLEKRLEIVLKLCSLGEAAREARRELAKQKGLAHGEALRLAERHDRLLERVKKAVDDLAEFRAKELNASDQIEGEE